MKRSIISELKKCFICVIYSNTKAGNILLIIMSVLGILMMSLDILNNGTCIVSTFSSVLLGTLLSGVVFLDAKSRLIRSCGLSETFYRVFLPLSLTAANLLSILTILCAMGISMTIYENFSYDSWSAGLLGIILIEILISFANFIQITRTTENNLASLIIGGFTGAFFSSWEEVSQKITEALNIEFSTALTVNLTATVIISAAAFAAANYMYKHDKFSCKAIIKQSLPIGTKGNG